MLKRLSTKSWDLHRRWTHLSDEGLQLGVAALLLRGPNLREQPDGRELRIRGEPRLNDGGYASSFVGAGARGP